MPDLRMPLLGVAAWVGALAAGLPTPWLAAAGVAGLAGLGLATAGRRLVVVAAVLVAGAVCCSALVRDDQVHHGPVAALAADGAAVRVEGSVVSDPRRTTGRFGPQVLVRVEVHRLAARGSVWRLAAPVLVVADDSWRRVRLGSTV
ncbi:MAG: hypothetical protein ACXVXR_18245, partial [Blastococcus sp.]